MIDMHVHILPGVDDGAEDAEMTRRMAERAADAGITFIVATPHVYRPEDQQRNHLALRTARSIAHEYGLGLNLGCEFNYRAILRCELNDLDRFCLSGTRCILLEFGFEQAFPHWDATISEIAQNGYLPIVAHPERYSFIQRDFGIAQEMCDLGCEMQVDAGGLMASAMGAERKLARRLVREGMVSYIASDAHRPEDYDAFEKAYKVFCGEWPRDNRLRQALLMRRRRPGGQS